VEPYQWALVLVAISGAALTAGGIIVSVTWKIGGIERTFVSAIATERASINAEHTAIRNSIANEIESLRRTMGEVGASLRQKIHEVEVWNRDNFARRDSVGAMRIEISEQFKTLTDQIDKRLDRIETKIDNGHAPQGE
jgi:hypothetical protein